MKPLFIHMKNIGPFVDEKLDFSSLDEVFLLCGDTGAGKTTIFDAMTYALYGEFLGTRKNKAKDFRSQYAKEGDESYVEFEFSSCGEKFRVRRTLPYAYTNRNGKRSIKDMDVSLEQWNMAEEKYEFFNGGKTEIKTRLEEIVGLRAEEFSKIVVLPQGEFSEFLHANSNAKQEMLKKLFPVDFYQSIVEKIKEENDSVQDEIKRLEKSMQELSKDIDFENADKRIAELTKEHEAKKAVLGKIREEKEDLAKKYTVLETELKIALELEAATAEKKGLEKKIPSIEKLEEKLALADDADAVVPFIEGLETRREEMEEAKKSADRCKTDVEAAEKVLDAIKASEKEIKETETLSEQEKLKLKSLEDKLEVSMKYEREASRKVSVAEKARKFSESLAELEKKKVLLSDEILSLAESVSVDGRDKSPSEIYRLVVEKFSLVRKKDQEVSALYGKVQERESLSKEIESYGNELKSLTEEKDMRLVQVENAEKLLAEYRMKKEEQRTNDAACALVSYLKPGCACPVCGSVEHPSPAKVSEDFLGLDDKILTAENSVKSEQELLAICSEKIAGSSKMLKKLGEDFEVLSKECHGKTLEESEKDAASLHEEMYRLQDATEKAESFLGDMESLGEKISQLKEELSAAVTEKSSLDAVLKTLEDQMKKFGGDKTDFSDIQNEIDLLSKLLESHLCQVQKFKDELQKADREVESSRGRLEVSEKSRECAVENFRVAKELLESKLSVSKFKDAEEAKSAFVKKADKLNLKDEVEEFRRELESLDVKIAVLSKKVSKKSSMLQQNANEVSAGIAEKQVLIDELSVSVEKLLSEKTSLEKDFNQYGKYAEKHGKLCEKAAPLANLYKDLSGSNPSKVQFETWFLGLYFDDVVTCANRHLLRISGERYEFKMDTEKTGGNSYHGLDLVVHDYRTNQERDAATLSGGETFMASISLALGLTEVVQKSSRLDSLFIDEGFGSLDKESLEMAVGVLQEIGNSRTVGVISHVEEMLGAISCHVEVKKTERGSHIVERI